MAKKREPTIEPSGGTVLPPAIPPKTIGDTVDDKQKILNALISYRHEAEENRKGGLNPRDDKWAQNLDLYWGRHDFTKKANWQAKEIMPEVPSYVDRFAAALKEALVSLPQGFYTVTDPADTEGDLSRAIKRMTDIWLDQVGRNQVGQIISFSGVFEEQMKLGAIMAAASVTTWKNDIKGGRVAIETVDPQKIWLDHTYRNLYRIRRTEIDRHELKDLVNSKDSKGNSIFDLEALNNLVGQVRQADEVETQRLTGVGTQVISGRQPVTLDEYIATVIGADGTVLADRSLIVVANDRFIIRGPEPNPFWHGKDWLTYAPLVTAPLSPYGRSYMEDFGAIAKTFTDLTNLILDAVQTSSLKVWAVVPGMLLNSGQLADGVSPNKTFLLEDGFKTEDFMKAVDMGTLPPESIAVWKAMKQELSEAARLNEIGLGQFAPKGRTSATEINETQQSSSALIRSVAQTVETRYLDPQLDLVWKTGLQHVDASNAKMAQAVGPELWRALVDRRKELITRPVTFQARGISTVIQRGQMLKSLLGIMSVIGQNEILIKAFLQDVDINKLVRKLFELSNIDLHSIEISERERMVRSVTEQLGAAQDATGGAGAPSGGASRMVNGVSDALGVGRG